MSEVLLIKRRMSTQSKVFRNEEVTEGINIIRSYHK